MTGRDEPMVLLATRIPRIIYREMRLHCGEAEIMIQDFIATALSEHLAGPSDYKPARRVARSATRLR
jgi:hypothetical protein